MTLPQIISRNQTQKIPTFPISGREVLQPEIWYTCPTGKKAICKGRVQCTGLGAAAEADFIVAGVVMYRWIVTANQLDYNINPRSLRVAANQMAEFEVELAAGETITTDQDSGTNAEFNLWMEVQESSV